MAPWVSFVGLVFGVVAGFILLAMLAIVPFVLLLVRRWKAAQEARARGDLVAAERHLARALVLARVAELLTKGPLRAATLLELAVLRGVQGRDAEAATLLEEARVIGERRRHKPTLATALQLTGEKLLTQGHEARAREPLERALVIWRSVALRPDVARNRLRCLNNLGVLERKAGKLDAAAKMFAEAVAIGDADLTTDPLLASIARLNLASVFVGQGRSAEAEPLLRRAVALREGALGRRHKEVASALRQLAAVLVENGKVGESDQLLARAVEIEGAS